jgi:hypothetical protein
MQLVKVEILREYWAQGIKLSPKTRVEMYNGNAIMLEQRGIVRIIKPGRPKNDSSVDNSADASADRVTANG